MTDHAGCAPELHERMAQQGVDVVVSTAAPLVRGPWTTHPFRCPHGVTLWMEPTGEQLVAWQQEATP